MKTKIIEWYDQTTEPKKKFCLIPRLAYKDGLPLSSYLVWLETVVWSDAYNGWCILEDAEKKVVKI